MTSYSKENKKICNKIWTFVIQPIMEKILDAAKKTGLDAAKTASKK